MKEFYNFSGNVSQSTILFLYSALFNSEGSKYYRNKNITGILVDVNTTIILRIMYKTGTRYSSIKGPLYQKKKKVLTSLQETMKVGSYLSWGQGTYSDLVENFKR